MKIKVNGQFITLTDREFLVSAGEANVYLLQKVIYKIYHDSTKVIHSKKKDELQTLKPKSNIIIPQDYIYDEHQKLIGTTYKQADGVVLCKYITNTYINQNNVSPDMMLNHVQQMQETIGFIHQQRCLIVDGNEYNFMMYDNSRGGVVSFIDVDSYKTQSFPATAHSPQIDDPHASQYNELTDWYAFGIISNMMFTGIHIFKGKHPKFKKNDVENRMKANISIFNKDVKLNSNVRINFIPDDYRQWYIETFEQGKRELPPVITGATTFTPLAQALGPIVKQTIGDFIIKLITQHKENITYHQIINGVNIFNHQDKDIIYIDENKYKKVNDNIRKYSIIRMKTTNIEVVDKQWDILPQSTITYDGLFISDVIGRCYFYIPSGPSCYIIPIKELDKKMIIEAKRIRNVVVTRTSSKQGDIYQKFIFNEKFQKYKVVKLDIDEINFTVSDTGTGAMIKEDRVLVLFSTDINNYQQKIVNSPDIKQTMHLTSLGVKCGFYEGNKLYSLEMK